MLNFADATASAAHPFVGLRPFTFEDSAFFFGREEQIDAVGHLVLGRMVCVVGSSGSGKSSLIRAGVLPRLSAGGRSAQWDWVEMRPGESPVRNLAEALARPNRTAGADVHDKLADARADRIALALQQSSFGIGQSLGLLRRPEGRRLLILVDQFEELFRFSDLRAQRNRNQRRAAEQRDEATFFVQLLLTAVADETLPACIMLTMRSDFIGECARFHGLSEAVTDTQYLVPGLTRDQRATAVRGPIGLAGATCETAVVQRLLNDSNEDPDQLPVMQHTMMRCWQRASQRGGSAHVTLGDYDAVGGFEGALTRHGDEELAALVAGGTAGAGGLTPGDVARRVFQSLTEVDSQGRVIRRPQTLADLVSVMAPDDAPAQRPAVDAAVRGVVLHFADPACSFLRAPQADELVDGSIIDIGHEALIRRWERLGGLDQQSWVRQEQSDAESYRTLLLYTQERGLVPRGQLRTFEAWWAARRPTRFWAQRYSRGGEDRLATAAEGLARSRAQVRRDKRVSRAAIAALCVLLAVSAGLALRQEQQSLRQEQRENERLAQEAQNQAVQQARQFAVEGLDELRSGSPQGALLLATYGLEPENRLWPAPEIEALAYKALDALRVRNIFTAAACTTASVTYTPDGDLITFAGAELAFWDPTTGRRDQFRKLRAPSMPFVYSLVPDPSGRFLLMSGPDQVLLVDLVTGAIGALDPGTSRLGAAAFSPDGRTIITSGRGASPKLWRFAPDGAQPTVTLVQDFATIAKPVAARTSGPAAISGGPQLVAVGNAETGDIELYAMDGLTWDKRLPSPADEAQQRRPGTASHGVTGLAFNPRNPDRLVATYAGAAPQVWDVGTATHTTLDMAPGQFTRVVFSPDGRFVAVLSADERVHVWDLRNEPRGGTLPPSFVLHGGGAFFSAAFDPDGRLATASNHGEVWLWDTEAALARGLPTDTGPAIAASRQTTMAARGETVSVQSSLAGVPSGPLGLPAGIIQFPVTLAVAADGAWGLVTPREGPVLLYDLHRPESPVAAFGPGSARWRSAAFSEGPDRIVAIDGAGAVQSWRWFRDRPSLLAFARSALPLLDGGQKATLPEATRQKLQGDFWTVLGAMRGASDEADCATPSALAASPASR